MYLFMEMYFTRGFLFELKPEGKLQNDKKGGKPLKKQCLRMQMAPERLKEAVLYLSLFFVEN